MVSEWSPSWPINVRRSARARFRNWRPSMPDCALKRSSGLVQRTRNAWPERQEGPSRMPDLDGSRGSAVAPDARLRDHRASPRSRSPSMKGISCVVCAYNEADRIRNILDVIHCAIHALSRGDRGQRQFDRRHRRRFDPASTRPSGCCRTLTAARPFARPAAASPPPAAITACCWTARPGWHQAGGHRRAGRAGDARRGRRVDIDAIEQPVALHAGSASISSPGERVGIPGRS